jgi:effector-binding domain-containing protein
VAYEVTVTSVAARPTLIVRGVSTRDWKPMLDQVWDCLHAAGITRGCPNVMLYLDDLPHVEIGVLLPASIPQASTPSASIPSASIPSASIPSASIPLAGLVVRSALPAGRVATTVHRGAYDRLGAAHKAILGSGLPLAGPRWEIYGPHQDIPETQVSYLLR